VLLFNQFAILRSRALLVIASGYLFTALMVIPWMLTFPGAFTPGGLLGAGLQTTNWLYNLWHVGFPTFVIAYVLVKDADPTKGLWRGSAGAAILLSVAVTAAVKQPLAAMINSANAGLNWLDRVEPDLDEVREALRHVVTAGHRADAVIENIR